MPSTYSPNLRIELIASGEQANTWGNTTNTNLGTLIEEAISGIATVDVTAGNVTLTALNGVTDQSRQMVLNVTGTPGVTRTLTAPAVSKVYVVNNGSNAAIAIDTVGAGGSVTVPAGVSRIVYSDGTEFFEASSEIVWLTGVSSNVQTQLNSKQAALGYTPVNKAGDTMSGNLLIQASALAYSYAETKTAPSISAGTLTLNCASSNVFQVNLTANITSISFTNIPVSPLAYGLTLSCVADGTARTIAWGASIKWPAGAPPTLTSTNGKVDTFVLYTYDGGTTWYAFIAGQNA